MVSPPRTVFSAGRGPAHTYRLPGLIALRDNLLLAAAHGRLHSARDLGASSIFVSRSADGGATWSSPMLALGDAHNRTMNAHQLIHDPWTGRVFLLANRVPVEACGASRRCGPCTTFVLHSDDHGASWSAPTPLADAQTHGSGVTSGTMLRVRFPGRLLAPRRADCCDCSGVARSFLLISDDRGASWRAGRRLPLGTTESAVVELPNGSVLLTSRALRGRASGHRGKRRLFARSDDGGETWASVWGVTGDGASQLKDPDCAAALGSASGATLFVNPSHPKRRCNLSLCRRTVKGRPAHGRGATGSALAHHTDIPSSRSPPLGLRHRSTDGGGRWEHAATIYAGRSAYSDVAVLRDGTVGVAFERERHRHISFATVRL